MAESQETLIDLIAKNFVGRREIKAVQKSDGAYSPVRTADYQHFIPWSRDDFRDHLTGKRTFGHYMLNKDSQVKFFMFDIDLKENKKNYAGEYLPWDGDMNAANEKNWVPCNPRVDFMTPGHPCIPWFNYELRWLAEGLARRIARTLDILTLIEFSGGKGLHVYGMTGLIDAGDARAAARVVLEEYGCFSPVKGDCFWAHDYAFTSMEIEVFPKQDSLKDESDLGNLIKLPLGTHAKTGRKSFFVQCVDKSDEFTEMPLEEALIKQPWE